ncbi:MAG TPA: TerC family protein [Burkholderiales bacterium]|nr:TerC family protein [Burkholderiales bacterium]
MDMLAMPAFWVGLLTIIWVNLLLSGDNAVVIALAARSLPPRQQKQAIFWGSTAAIVLRIILTVFAVKLLTLPFLKLVGGALLLWIGVQLLVPEDGEADVKASDNLLVAIRTILVADLVMSLDNVIGVAAAAESAPAEAKLVLLILGLAISIPIVIFGSTLVLKLMERFPVVITVGAALLGWIAGDMMASDPAIVDWVKEKADWLLEMKVAAAAGAALVVLIGTLMARKGVAESGA